MAPKPWGWWTKHKLQILEDYLKVFVKASSGVSERIYLDLFAGWPENTSRETNEEILGSVHRALAVEPPFTQIRLFELPTKAKKLEAALQQRYPTRHEVQVCPGDCNQAITAALAELAPIRWAPTFAFIDQFAAEVQWSTLEQIAAFRRGKTKAEMWILFGTSFLPRGLQLGQDHMNAEFGDRLTGMYGSNEWEPIIHGRRRALLTATQARVELVNLMRWRLEKVLGYRSSYAFTMKNTNGHELYDMIFVSDHPVGDKVMRHLYGKALAQHETMRQRALLLRRAQREKKKLDDIGATALFDLDPNMIAEPECANDQIYEPEPPRSPYRLP